MEEEVANMVALNMMSMAPLGTLSRAGVQDEDGICLTAAEDFSDAYDDQQFAFLRQQEVDSYVGAGYLRGIVRLGMVTPTTRTVLVDWVAGPHAAASVACGDCLLLSRGTFFLAINTIDSFLATREGAKAVVAGDWAMKLTAAVALSLPSKHDNTNYNPRRGLWWLWTWTSLGVERTDVAACVLVLKATVQAVTSRTARAISAPVPVPVPYVRLNEKLRRRKFGFSRR